MIFFHPEHELHKRRRSRNMGLFGVLFGLVAVIFGLTIAKVRLEGESVGRAPAVQTQVDTGTSK